LPFVASNRGRLQSAVRRASESHTLFRQLGDTLQARWGYMSPRRLTMAGQADRAAGTLDALDASASRRIYRTTT